MLKFKLKKGWGRDRELAVRQHRDLLSWSRARVLWWGHGPKWKTTCPRHFYAWVCKRVGAKIVLHSVDTIRLLALLAGWPAQPTTATCRPH